MKVQEKILYKLNDVTVNYYIFKPRKKTKNTIMITGGIHGLELVSSAALWLLKEHLIYNELPYNIILVPCINIIGARQGTRTLNNIDINRAFPGNPDGNIGEKIAAVLAILIKQCNVLIDVHSAGECIPFIIIDRLPKTNKISKWAKSCGALVLDEIHEYLQDGETLYNTFSWYANSEKKITLTLELSGSNKITDEESLSNFQVVLKLLENVNLIGQEDKPLLTKMEFVSPTSGYFSAVKKPGDKVLKGDIIGVIKGLGGNVINKVIADNDCVLVKLPDNPFNNKNDVLGFIGKYMN